MNKDDLHVKLNALKADLEDLQYSSNYMSQLNIINCSYLSISMIEKYFEMVDWQTIDLIEEMINAVEMDLEEVKANQKKLDES